MKKRDVDIEKVDYIYDINKLRIEILEAPARKDKPASILSDAKFVIGGGHGLNSKANFNKLYDLANILKYNWVEPDALL